jgi:hypothetical protein
MTFDKTLDAVMKLDYDSKELLIELVRKRLVEERRKKIAREAAKTRRNFQKGKLKPKTAAQVIKELEAYLNK